MSGNYFTEIEGLRFIAIFAVALLHTHTHVTRYAKLPAESTIDPLFLQLGKGVQLFFVISGFLLGLPFASAEKEHRTRPSLLRYFERRITRLEPPYFLNILLLYALLIAFHYGTQRQLFPHLLASLAYLHVPIYGTWSSVNPVSWSLEIEVQFYVLVPLLALLFRIRSLVTRRSILIALIVAFAWIRMQYASDPRVALTFLGNATFFFAGFLLADLYLWNWARSPRPQRLWDFVALGSLPAFFFLQGWTAGLMLPFFALLLCIAAFRGIAFRWCVTRDWIAIIGGMCYTIYLFHYQVIAGAFFLTSRLGTALSPLSYFGLQLVLLLAFVLVFSAIWFVLIERPCMIPRWPLRLWTHLSKRPATPRTGSAAAVSH